MLMGGGVVVWYCMHAKWLFILYRAHRTVLSNSVQDDFCLWCVVKVLPFSGHTENRATLQVDFTLMEALWENQLESSWCAACAAALSLCCG